MHVKHIFFTFIATFVAIISHGQIPQGFSYQAVIRDNNGEPMANQDVILRFSIWHLDSPESITAYQETQSITSNEFGLVNHVV
ncbi:MAG: hypothetical protein JNM00_12905, partial [Flavobacteriales bacterium]|nr:hypothetical protein [Flavobacteriales bacterium]